MISVVQTCRNCAILEIERRFFCKKTEEIFDELDNEYTNKVTIYFFIIFNSFYFFLDEINRSQKRNSILGFTNNVI